MSKFGKLLTSTFSFQKFALANYLAIKLANHSLVKVANAALLAKAEELSYSIKDENLSEQFELYVETYKSVIDGLKSGGSIQDDEDLGDQMVGLTNQLNRFKNNPYLVLGENSDNWAEEFDPSEFTDLISDIYQDAETQFNQFTDGEISMNELALRNIPEEFSDARVDRADKSNSGLTWTGNKAEQSREAYENRKQKLVSLRKLRDAGRATPGTKAYEFFKALTERNKAYWSDLVADPERMKAHRAKATPRQVQYLKFDERKNKLLNLLERTYDPEDKAKILERIRSIDSSAKKTNVSQQADVERKHNLLEVGKGDEDGPEKLQGLTLKLRHLLHDQRKISKEKLLKAKDEYKELTNAIKAAKKAGNAEGLTAANQTLKDKTKELMDVLQEHEEVKLYDLYAEPLHEYIKRLMSLAKSQILFTGVPENQKPFIEEIVQEGTSLLNGVASQSSFSKSNLQLATILGYMNSKIGKTASYRKHLLSLEKRAQEDMRSSMNDVDAIVDYVDSLGISDPNEYTKTLVETMLDFIRA